MGPDDGVSSDVEDVGRLESQAFLRDKSDSSSWLSDLMEQAELDYRETMEMIERERKMIDAADQNFLSSLDLAFHDKAREKAEDTPPRHNTKSNEDGNDAFHQIQALLHASETILAVHRQANAALSITRESVDQEDATHRQTLSTDRERVKQILAAGRRLVEREIEGFQRGEEEYAGDDEVNVQASSIFDGRKKAHPPASSRSPVCLRGNGQDLTRSLKCVEKGVRKMARGLDGV